MSSSLAPPQTTKKRLHVRTTTTSMMYHLPTRSSVIIRYIVSDISPRAAAGGLTRIGDLLGNSRSHTLDLGPMLRRLTRRRGNRLCCLHSATQSPRPCEVSPHGPRLRRPTSPLRLLVLRPSCRRVSRKDCKEKTRRLRTVPYMHLYYYINYNM